MQVVPLTLEAAVEVLCIALMRQTRQGISPNRVKETLRADVAGTGAPLPSKHECETLVASVVEGLEPVWFSERWPRTLGLIQLQLQ